jgi:TRAP-type C4-dicarboxylate transport system permease small subunit
VQGGGPSAPDALAAAIRAAEFVVRLASQAAAGLAGLACLACLGLVCYGVAARYFWGRPQPWSDEVVVWLVVACVLLATPEAQRRNEHIGVDALLEKASGRVRHWMLLFGLAAVAATALTLLIEGIEMVAFTRLLGLRPLVNPEMPLWLVQALLPLSAGLLLAVVAVQIVARLTGLTREAPPARLSETE